MMTHGIDLNTPAIREFCRKWKIKELSVFGSILRTDFRPDSDIDFLADFEDDEEWDLFDGLEMEEELAQILGRKVDLLTRYSVESDTNWIFKNKVLSSAEPVYVR